MAEAIKEADQSRGIPRIVFQTIKTRKKMPANFAYWRGTFLDHNPGHRFYLWDDEDNRAFIEDVFPWFLPVYDAFPAGIFRADAVRPLFLFSFGGFYVDLDTECLRPLSGIVPREGVILGSMGTRPSFPHSVPNAIMASSPLELFWLLYVALILEKATEVGDPKTMASWGPEEITGPVVLREAYLFYSSRPSEESFARAEPVISHLGKPLRKLIRTNKVYLLEPDLWYPLDWTNSFHRMLRHYLRHKHHLINAENARKLFPQASMVTYWTHSWE